MQTKKPLILPDVRYKLVAHDYTSYNRTPWRDKDGKWLLVSAARTGAQLCSGEVIHFYDSPHIALLMNPVHANVANPRLLKICCSKTLVHDGLKGGCKQARAIGELTLPTFTIQQKVQCVIRLARFALKFTGTQVPVWESWAAAWLAGGGSAGAHATATAAAAAHAAYAADADDGAAHAASYAASAAAYADPADAAHAALKFRKHIGGIIKNISQDG